MTKERRFKKEYSSELLRVANEDFIAAKSLARDSAVRKEIVFFHFQQSVEKALKACLCANSQSVPLVHDIAVLVERLGMSPPHEEFISDLSDFAGIRRYEEGIFEISDQEINSALLATREVLDWCAAFVSKSIKK